MTHRLLVFGMLTAACPVDASIVLKSTAGTENVSMATTMVRIDTRGRASLSADFTGSGSITNATAHGTEFKLTLDAISAATLDWTQVNGEIDRHSGKLGVRGVRTNQ